MTIFAAVTDFTVTMDRSLVISFAEPITQIYHSLFIQNPTGNLNFMAYIEPFYWTTWLFLVFFICATPPILYSAAKYLKLNN